MRVKVLLFFAVFLLSIKGFSVDEGKIKGVLWDTLTNNGIGSATITVFRLSDSSIMNFTISNNAGTFEVNKLPLNTPLRLLFSHINYSSYRKPFTLTEDKKEIDFDTIVFTPKVFEMEGVIVTGEKAWDRPPILIQGDTMSFHADAFLNRPGTVVEDLLKRIPGIEFTSEGITMNGRKVSRILLDGREFFGSDPTMLLKNIPAMMIDAVQVTEEKDEFGDVTESGNVTINVTLKPGAKKGNFGKVFGGYGTTDRYETGLIWNVFRDTMQLSFIGYANNLSKSGFSFSDLYNLGGFNRQSFSSVSFSGNSLSIGNTSFGGGDGITESFGGGVNFSHVLFKKAEVSLSYFNGNQRTTLSNISSKQYILADSSFLSESNRFDFNRGMAHNYSGLVRFKIDSTSTLFYKVEGTFSTANNQGEQVIRNLSENLGLDNKIDNNIKDRIRYSDFSGRIIYSKKINSKLNFYLFNNHSFSSNSANDVFNQMALIGAVVYNEESFEQNRKRKINTLSQSSHARFRYTWKKGIVSSLLYEYKTNNRSNTIDSEQRPDANSEFNRIEVLSGLFNSRVNSQTFSKEFQIEDKKLTKMSYTGSAGYNIYRLYANERDRMQHRNNLYQRPVFSLRVSKRMEKGSFYASFYQNFNQPSIEQMVPILNNTNPRFVNTGNYLLEPTFSHSINSSGNWTFKKLGLTFSLYTNMSWNENSVISIISYDELGRETSTFSNYSEKLGFSNYNSSGLSKIVKLNEKWSMPLSFRVNGGLNKNFQIIFSELNEIENISFGLTPSVSLNKKDVLEFTVSYSRRINNNKASLTQTQNRNIFHSVSSSVWLKLPKGFSVEYEYNLNYQPFIESGITNGFNLMNFSINKSILKDNKGVLKLTVFDLFSQNMDFGRLVTQNYVEEYQKNTVVRYIMLSFVYNVNSLSAADKTRGKGKEFRYW